MLYPIWDSLYNNSTHAKWTLCQQPINVIMVFTLQPPVTQSSDIFGVTPWKQLVHFLVLFSCLCKALHRAALWVPRFFTQENCLVISQPLIHTSVSSISTKTEVTAAIWPLGIAILMSPSTESDSCSNFSCLCHPQEVRIAAFWVFSVVLVFVC